jgi:O-antigen/teichoic acid export membrane protein
LTGLKHRSAEGVFWSLIENFGIQFAHLILGIILARLLTPNDYGLIGIITFFFIVSHVFIDSGFGRAYIQKKDADEIDASTIFYFNLFVSFFLYIILWLTAPLISNFYEQPQLIKLVRVMSVVLIVKAFSIIQIAKLTKKIDFKKKTIVLLVSAVVAGLSGIIAALLNCGVWSLVIQGVINESIKTIGLWFSYKWKPLLTFSLQSMKSMFSFSSWVLLTGIVSQIFNNIYILVIGKFFPISELGFYTKAKQFQQKVSHFHSGAVSAVAFPVFCQLQDDKDKVKNAMRKFSQNTMFFIAPISALLIAIAYPLFLILLTEKWIPMVPYFQLLCVAGILYPIHLMNVQTLVAQGKTNLNFRITIIKSSLRIINIAVMYRFGVIYIILGEILVSFFALAINGYYTKRLINYGIIEQLKDLSSITLTSGILSLVGLMLTNRITNPYLSIFIGVVLIGCVYLSIMYYFNKRIITDNLELIKGLMLKFNKVKS